MAAAIVLLFGSVFVLAVMPVSIGPARNSFGERSALFTVIYISALAAWGIITGIGLLRLWAWARASVLLFSAFGVWWIFGMTIVDVSFATAPPRPGIDPSVFRESIILSLPGNLALLAIFTWWVVLFFLPGVKRQFEQSGAACPPLPLSLMLVGVGLIALIPLREGMFLALPMQLPHPILWYSVHGLAGPLYSIAVILAAVVFGFGVLRRTRWGQFGAAVYCLFMVIDYGYRTWLLGVDAIRFLRRIHPSFGEAVQDFFTTATSDALGLVLLAIALYLLWSRRAVFVNPRTPTQAPASVEGGSA